MDYPNVIEVKLFATEVDLTLAMDPKLEAFKGHFDSKPIVPGVVQIQWAIQFAEVYLEDVQRIEVEQINSLKFHNIITPSSIIKLNLKLIKDKLEFSYNSPELKHSSGKIIIH